MSKEFRFWDKQENCFVDSIYANKNCYLLIDKLGAVVAYDDNGEIDLDDRIIVQQFAGLTDSSGYKIFEGDIVCEKITSEMAANGESANVGRVFFAAGTFMIDGDGPLYEHTHSLTPDRLEDYLVVGNIFETPELLKP